MSGQTKITLKDVEYVAALSRLGLGAEEKELYRGQLGDILAYVGKLNELDTSDVAPMTHPADVKNVCRPDEPMGSMDRGKALGNAPDTDGKYFIVPKVIE